MGIYFSKKKSFKTHYQGKMTLYATLLNELRLEDIDLKCFETCYSIFNVASTIPVLDSKFNHITAYSPVALSISGRMVWICQHIVSFISVKLFRLSP